MFEGDAEESVQFYVSIFAKSKIESQIKYGAAGPVKKILFSSLALS
jgi:predicted 3-demethylubiquinone-9 3-methyltransferase (glyoxalase superfamily)